MGFVLSYLDLGMEAPPVVVVEVVVEPKPIFDLIAKDQLRLLEM